MAALTSRIILRSSRKSKEGEAEEVEDGPEDFLLTSLGVIFPDDVMNQHGDAEHSLEYNSPFLRASLFFDLADPEGETDKRLFSHYMWNASLLLAELVERDSLDAAVRSRFAVEEKKEEKNEEEGGRSLGEGVSFDVRGLRTLELGAGTALPSVMAGLLGARSVAVTDYPAPAVLQTLRANVARNLSSSSSSSSAAAAAAAAAASSPAVVVEGHAWGSLDDAFSQTHRGAFDRVFAADCLWMPWQHENLRRSIGHFLSESDPAARAWVVAGFHTGRGKMAGFFDAAALKNEAGLEVERIWEVDCDGAERGWVMEREEDISVRKRWLAVAVLKRVED